MNKPRGGVWSTRIGFYIIAMSSAFGLGNLWRFPYVVAENGGGSFVLLYVFLVFVIGTPLIIGELIMGRKSQSHLLSSVDQVNLNHGEVKIPQWLYWIKPYAGFMGLFVCALVLSYFSVISGWVLYYCIEFLMSSVSSETLLNPEVMANLKSNGWLQVLLTSIHLLLVIIIIAKNFEEGLETWVGYIMPAFFVLLVGLAVKSLSLETSKEALQFFFYPDFSKLTAMSLAYALGHILFSLSLGFGTIISFGKLLRKRSYIPAAGLRMTTLDSLLSLFAGLLIFPLVILGAKTVSGPDLLFQTVPLFLSGIPRGDLFGFAFFLCLYLAALGSSISLLETIVANMVENKKIKRFKCTWITGVACLVIAIFPALSSSVLSTVTYRSVDVLQMFDLVLINWVLPIVALIMSQLMYYGLTKKEKEIEFLREDDPNSPKVYKHWAIVLRWVFPGLVILAMSLQIIHLI